MTYRELLVALRDLLAHHDVKPWPERVSNWIEKLERTDKIERDHVARRRTWLRGPSRLDDIVICKENGHRTTNRDEERAANDRRRDLLTALNAETSAIMES